MSLLVHTSTPISRRGAPRRMSIAEWTALPEGEAGELVDGYLVEEEVASSVHEQIISWLIFLLTAWIDPQDGFVFGSELKYAVAADRGRKPDLSVFFPTNALPPADGPVEIPPDIMVEVVSQSPKDDQRDRVEKPDEYAAFGVRWYWIVDPRQRSLEIFELGADRRYARARAASGGLLQDVPGCPGLKLDLDGLWKRVDRLLAAESP